MLPPAGHRGRGGVAVVRAPLPAGTPLLSAGAPTCGCTQARGHLREREFKGGGGGGGNANVKLLPALPLLHVTFLSPGKGGAAESGRQGVCGPGETGRLAQPPRGPDGARPAQPSRPPPPPTIALPEREGRPADGTAGPARGTAVTLPDPQLCCCCAPCPTVTC